MLGGFEEGEELPSHAGVGGGTRVAGNEDGFAGGDDDLEITMDAIVVTAEVGVLCDFEEALVGAWGKGIYNHRENVIACRKRGYHLKRCGRGA